MKNSTQKVIAEYLVIVLAVVLIIILLLQQCSVIYIRDSDDVEANIDKDIKPALKIDSINLLKIEKDGNKKK